MNDFISPSKFATMEPLYEPLTKENIMPIYNSAILIHVPELLISASLHSSQTNKRLWRHSILIAYILLSSMTHTDSSPKVLRTGRLAYSPHGQCKHWHRFHISVNRTAAINDMITNLAFTLYLIPENNYHTPPSNRNPLLTVISHTVAAVYLYLFDFMYTFFLFLLIDINILSLSWFTTECLPPYLPDIRAVVLSHLWYD